MIYFPRREAAVWLMGPDVVRRRGGQLRKLRTRKEPSVGTLR